MGSPQGTGAGHMTGGDDGFLSRWSRRKRDTAATQPGTPPEGPLDLPVEPETGPDAPPDAHPDPIADAELAALPRIEDLTAGSDITGFLRPGVPRALKNAALRQIWMATPAIRDYCDPAVDYAWDWNTPGGVPGDGCAPAPEVAARMMRDLFAPRAPQTPPAADPAAPQDDSPVPSTPDAAPDDAAPVQTAAADAHDAAALDDEPAAEPTPPRRRHGGALPG